jgi:hypothetical protein
MKPIEPHHRCRGSFPDSGEESFPIIWIRADSLDPLRLLRRTAKKLFVGVCGFSHRPFKVAHDGADGALELILFNDLEIVKGRCEEESRCLAQQCPLNRTPDSMLKKLLGTRDKTMREKIGKQLRGLTGSRQCSLFDQNSKGGILLPSSPNRKTLPPPTASA